MSITIELDKYDNDGAILYKTDKIEFNPGVTILVGCNGSGKTTLMNQIDRKHHYSNSNIISNIFTCCDTYKEMDRMMYDPRSYDYSMDKVATMICSSEGERIAIGLTSAFDWMWAQCRNSEIHSIFMLLDSLDSGLDVSNLRMIYNVIEESVGIAKNDFSTDLYVIISANDYALVENHKCLDIYTGETITFKDFNEYSEFAMKSTEIKEKRYEKETDDNNDNDDDYGSWRER